MKKGLLSFIAAFVAVFSVSAQDGYWQKDYPWDASGYTAWTAVADTFQTSVWMDSLIVVETSLGGLTNFDNDIIAETGWEADGTRYAVTGSGDVASIAFSPSKSEWSNFQVAFYKWVTGPAPSATTVLMSDHRIGGYLVDMQPSADGIANGVISGEINIPSALNSTDIYAAGSPAEGKFLLRMSIVDAHGHEWNAGGDPIDTLDVYDAWTPFSFDYNTFISEKVGNVEANPGDGWGGKFNDMDRPIAGSDGERAPLDLTMVRAIRFYFNPGVKVAGTTLDANTVQMRDRKSVV